ncbi:hypothetical protein ACQEVZ_60710 [Dactylosporangium sp. CA-152071]|uniref:hypothetical protein n=1 Tax=Dactylosporangium sp. CA-152071 TaxID=3239933 RepID=UPI003D9318C1
MTDNPTSGPPGQPAAATSGGDPADQTADQVARAEISRHYAGKVEAARTALEKATADLQRKLDAAEAARVAWEQHQEITSTAAHGEPRAADLVESEVLSLLLSVDRVTAVKRWLVAHGHATSPRLRHALSSAASTQFADQLTKQNGDARA